MPSRNIIAVLNPTDRANLIQGSFPQAPASGSGGVAPFGYETDIQSLVVYDPVTATFYAVPVATLNGLTITAAQINQAFAPQANGGITFAPIAYARYNFAVDGGADSTLTPAVNVTIPAFAIITGCVINVTTAVTSAGSATVGIGLSAGGGTSTSLLGQTAKATLSLDALLAGVPVPQTAATWIKLSAAAQITVTPAVATLTAGVIEIFVDYVGPASVA